MEDPAAMPVRQVGVVVAGAPAEDSIALGARWVPSVRLLVVPLTGVSARRDAIPSRCIPPCTAGCVRRDLRKAALAATGRNSTEGGMAPALAGSCPEQRNGKCPRWLFRFHAQGTWPDRFELSVSGLGDDLMTESRGYMAGRNAARRVADLLPAADRRADWGPVRALFQQLVQLAESEVPLIPDELKGAFADEIAAISASYAGREAELCEHVLAILAGVESGEILGPGLFRKYYEDERFSQPRESAYYRRRPGSFEAIAETCRRLRDAGSLRAACRDTNTSGMLIGSMSYGRFYNIRGNRHGTTASDLDLIVVIDQASALHAIRAAAAALPGVAVPDLEHFGRRACVFADSMDDRGTVFSHKIRLWADSTPDPVLPAGAARGDYLLSLHIVTPPVLDYLLVASTPRLLKESAGNRRTLRDYRQAATSRTDDLYDFAGRRYTADLEAYSGHPVEMETNYR
jgi:hypothetical protein